MFSIISRYFAISSLKCEWLCECAVDMQWRGKTSMGVNHLRGRLDTADWRESCSVCEVRKQYLDFLNDFTFEGIVENIGSDSLSSYFSSRQLRLLCAAWADYGCSTYRVLTQFAWENVWYVKQWAVSDLFMNLYRFKNYCQRSDIDLLLFKRQPCSCYPEPQSREIYIQCGISSRT